MSHVSKSDEFFVWYPIFTYIVIEIQRCEKENTYFSPKCCTTWETDTIKYARSHAARLVTLYARTSLVRRYTLIYSTLANLHVHAVQSSDFRFSKDCSAHFGHSAPSRATLSSRGGSVAVVVERLSYKRRMDDCNIQYVQTIPDPTFSKLTLSAMISLPTVCCTMSRPLELC